MPSIVKIFIKKKIDIPLFIVVNNLCLCHYPLGLIWSHIRTTQGGVTDPIRPYGPSLRPLPGPGVRLPKIVTFHRGDAAARAVIGPLTKTRRRTRTGSRLR